MFDSVRRKVTCFIVLTALSISVVACGNADPHQLGMNSFSDKMTAYLANHKQPTSEWTVYVGHGMVTKGWLWFKQQNPVVYTNVEFSGTADIKNIAIKFGDKTVTIPEMYTRGIGLAGTGFYLNSSQIPSYMDISWSENGQPHHVHIEPKTMIELDSLP